MRNKEKILNKLNDLLVTNHELENIYAEASKTVTSNTLKTFFKELESERKSYNQSLSLEIEKLLGDTTVLQDQGSDAYKVSMAYRGLIFMKDHSLIVSEVCRIKEITINKYNALLSELNLPLSLCKLLSAQRDGVQANLNAVKRLEHLMVDGS